MNCLILRAFEYSVDGHNLRPAAAGDIVDIPDSQVPGLFKEGFVGEPKPVPAPVPASAAKMMLPLENKDAGSPPNTTATGGAPKGK